MIYQGFSLSEYSAYLRRIRRADERTRTADLISLRVIHQALQGFARGCKSRISRRLSLLGVAACCTVLRSRWYQSGINPTLVSAALPSVTGCLWSTQAGFTSCDWPVILCRHLTHLAVRHRPGTCGRTSPPWSPPRRRRRHVSQNDASRLRRRTRQQCSSPRP